MATTKKLSNSWGFKILGIIILGIIVYMSVDRLLFKGARSFYCLSDDECVTVWKRLDSSVYIVSGKYKNNTTPTTSYIKTNNKQLLTLYFTEQLPNKIIVKNEGNYENGIGNYSLKNRKEDKWQFVEYSNQYQSILYKPNASKFKDVKINTNYMSINIKENYATDKAGKKIEDNF